MAIFQTRAPCRDRTHDLVGWFVRPVFFFSQNRPDVALPDPADPTQPYPTLANPTRPDRPSPTRPDPTDPTDPTFYKLKAP